MSDITNFNVIYNMKITSSFLAAKLSFLRVNLNHTLIPLKELGCASEDNKICMSSTFSSSGGLGAVSSSAKSFAASSKIGKYSVGCL